MTEYRFPLRPVMRPDESLKGYCKRLAQLLTVDSVVDLGKPLKIGLGYLHNEKELHTLAAALDMCVLDLDQRRFVFVDKYLGRLMGHVIPSYFVNIGVMKVCPCCIADDPYHRLQWELAFIRACAKHNVKLIDACPECGTELSWTSPSMVSCGRCGFDLRTAEVEPIDPDDVKAIGRLLTAVSRNPDAGASGNLPRIMQGMSVHGVVEFSLFLGRLKAELSEVDIPDARTFSDDVITAVLRMGLEVADHWPFAAHELMATYRRKKGKPGSMSDQLGYISRKAVNGPTEWAWLVKDALADYLVDNPDIPCRPNSDLNQEVLKRRGFFTLKEAQALLKVHDKRFRSVRKSPAWAQIKASVDAAGFVRIDLVEEIVKELTEIVSLPELGRMIGINDKEKLRVIAEGDVFHRIEVMPHHDQRTSHWRKSEVDELLHLMDALSVVETVEDGQVDFKKAVTLATQRGLDLADVTKLLLAGKMVPLGRMNDKGVEALVFPRSKAVGLFDAMAQQRTGSLSLREVAERLHVLEREAYLIAKLGLLKVSAVKGQSNLRGRRATEDDIAEFDAKYVSARKFAHESGVPIDEVRQRIRKMKAMPRVSPRAEIYQRTVLRKVAH